MDEKQEKPKKEPVNIESVLSAFVNDLRASIPALRETENHNRFMQHIAALKKNLK